MCTIGEKMIHVRKPCVSVGKGGGGGGSGGLEKKGVIFLKIRIFSHAWGELSIPTIVS